MKKIFHNEKGSIKQEAKTILNMYALNDTTSKYIKIDIINYDCGFVYFSF